MAYYCGECVVWVGSSDVDRYGRRWCSYSRRYEESNQNTYGCKGFVYNGRTVLTKVCEILDISTDKWFEAFDAVKNDRIYQGVGFYSKPIGEFRNGTIYSGVGFMQRSIIGTSDDIEGAAALLLLQLELI